MEYLVQFFAGSGVNFCGGMGKGVVGLGKVPLVLLACGGSGPNVSGLVGESLRGWVLDSMFEVVFAGGFKGDSFAGLMASEGL